LMVMAAGFSILFLAMHLKAMRNEILRRRAVALERSVVQRSAARATSTAGV
jgi:heme exporter protein C